MLCLGVGLPLASTAYITDPNALWNVVHNLCVPNEERFGVAIPCQLVDFRNGYVVLKDLVGHSHFLVIPTARVTGIESPVLRASDAPNYFAMAWRARTYVEHALDQTLPRDDIVLAVNSASARTQNQLHIHIDCVRADVRTAMHQHEATIRDSWTPLGILLVGHRYMAMKVEDEQLDRVNPFKALADGMPGARDDIRYHTLVVIGATFTADHPGFIILDDHADLATGDSASGEELQDHTCAIAKPWSE